MSKKYWVYILCSKRYGTLYIGVTNDIDRRIYEHKKKLIEGFTKKYALDKVVYIEEFNTVNEAIYREKCLKKWKRSWKLDLIDAQNPTWQDLYAAIFEN